MDDLNRYALDLGFKKTIFFTKKTNLEFIQKQLYSILFKKHIIYKKYQS